MKHNVLRATALVSGMILASCGIASAACLDGYDCGVVTGMGEGDHGCFHFTLHSFLDDQDHEYALDALNDRLISSKLKVIVKNESLSLQPSDGVACQNQLLPGARALHNPAKQQ